MPLLLLILCLLTVAPAGAQDGVPTALREADFGPHRAWNGFLPDQAIGLVGTPGRLTSLRKGFLAWRPIRIQHEWDFLELVLRNDVAGDGMLQLRLSYGIGGPERFYQFRHGHFQRNIPLNFAGTKRIRLEREDFTPYGGPIGWLDDQLVGMGLFVVRAPSQKTRVHLVEGRLERRTLSLTAERDLLRTDGAPAVFRLRARSRDSRPHAVTLRLHTEAFAPGPSPDPFAAGLSGRKFVLPAGGSAEVTLTTAPRNTAKPGDAATYRVTVEDGDDPFARAHCRVSVAFARPAPALQEAPPAPPIRRDIAFPDCPPLPEAEAVMGWTLRAAQAFTGEGNPQAGEKLAAVLRTLGDPEKGYPALCTQTFYPMTGRPGSEPPFETQKTWYQAFFWTAPISLAKAYDLVAHTGLLNDKERQRFEDNCLRPLARLGVLTLNACANGQEQILASTLAAGLACQDPDLIRQAITGPFGWDHAIGHDMLDGISMEGSMTYMWYITWPSLADAAQMASHSGIDLFHRRCRVIADRNHVFEADQHSPSRNGIWPHDTQTTTRFRTFMDCLHGMLAITYPSGRFPKLHDTEDETSLPIPTVYFRNPLCHDEVMKLLGAADPRPVAEYGGRFTLLHRPEALKRPSVNLSAIGLAILRGGDGNRPEDPYLLLDYGPHGGVHGHRDKLQFVFWRHGMELAPDPPICDLDVPAWSQYYQQSASHNTIILDGASQLPSTGERCLAFRTTPGAQLVEVEASAAYAAQDARVRRLALLTQEYVVLLDRIVSPRAHTIDFVLHGAGKAPWETSLPPAPASGPLGERDGYRWIARQGEASAAGPWEARCAIGDEIGMRLLSPEDVPTRILTGTGFSGYRRGHRPVPDKARPLPAWEGPDETLPDAVLVARRSAAPGTTQFIHVLEGFRGASRIARVTASKNALTIVLIDGATDTIRWSGGERPGVPTRITFQRTPGAGRGTAWKS